MSCCLVTKSCLTLATILDCSLPGFSVHGIPEYWSELPFPSPGDLSNPGVKPRSPALAGRFFTTEPSGKLILCLPLYIYFKCVYLEQTFKIFRKIEGRRRRGRQRMRRLNGITNWMEMSLSKLQKLVTGREAWCAAIYGEELDMTE